MVNVWRYFHFPQIMMPYPFPPSYIILYFDCQGGFCGILAFVSQSSFYLYLHQVLPFLASSYSLPLKLGWVSGCCSGVIHETHCLPDRLFGSALLWLLFTHGHLGQLCCSLTHHTSLFIFEVLLPFIPTSLSPNCAWWSLSLTFYYVQLRNNYLFSHHRRYFYDGNHHYHHHQRLHRCNLLYRCFILTLFLSHCRCKAFCCRLSLLQIGTHSSWKSHYSRCMDERLGATLLTAYFQETWHDDLGLTYLYIRFHPKISVTSRTHRYLKNDSGKFGYSFCPGMEPHWLFYVYFLCSYLLFDCAQFTWVSQSSSPSTQLSWSSLAHAFQCRCILFQMFFTSNRNRHHHRHEYQPWTGNCVLL